MSYFSIHANDNDDIRYSDCVILTRTEHFSELQAITSAERMRKQKAERKNALRTVERIILCYMRAIKKQKGIFYYTIFNAQLSKVFFSRIPILFAMEEERMRTRQAL